MNEQLRYLMDAIRVEVTLNRTSVKALAMAAGVSYPAMRRYLKGERAMDLAQLYRVADVLNTTASALVHEAERRESADRAAQEGRGDSVPGRTDGPTDRPTDRPTSPHETLGGKRRKAS